MEPRVITETERVMDQDPRGMGYLFPSIPPSVVRRRICQWYDRLVSASIVDTLRASNKVAVSRNFLTEKRRREFEDKRIRLGRRTYYVMDRIDVPKRAKRNMREDWPIVDYHYGEMRDDSEAFH